MTTRIGRTGWARAAGVAAALPLAFGALLAAAPAAGAAVTAPGDGAVFTSYSTITIRADFGPSSTDHRLELTSPGGGPVTVATAPANRIDGGSMTYALDTGCWTYPSRSCSGRRLAPNGTWRVTQSGGGSGSSTFVTRIKPAAPSSVSATAISSREARVSWRLGDEPDLVGWQVLEGSEVVKSGSRGDCDGTACSAVITYATDGSGEHTYAVRVLRAVAPGSSATLDSDLSSPASARLETPPPSPEPQPEPEPEPEPAPEPAPQPGGSGGGTGTGGESGGGSGSGSGTGSGGGSGSGGTSGGTSGGSGGSGGNPAPGSAGFGIGSAPAASADERAVAQRKAFALSFSAFGPKLGVPKLPPLPQALNPTIAPELADGTFEPTLGFEEQEFTEQVEVAQGPTARVRNVVDTALDSERLIRSTAAALVLLLAGAHLRRWLGAAREE